MAPHKIPSLGVYTHYWCVEETQISKEKQRSELNGRQGQSSKNISSSKIRHNYSKSVKKVNPMFISRIL